MPMALRQFGRLPESVRHVIVGLSSPAHRVGTVALITSGDEFLLCRHSYRDGWSLPGGMMGWKEAPEDCVLREVQEEVGLDVKISKEPDVQITQDPRRILFAYQVELDGSTADDAHPVSAEIEEAKWFRFDDPPALHWWSDEVGTWFEKVREERLAAAGTIN
ncbi:MAG: 8-oxo-dGTP diphosphatase [Candidatus Poriferisodalaceae bacterium]|jgi:8-oxo-dGTP diphosphatase